MTTRRNLLMMMAAAGAGAVAGCDATRPTASVGVPDVLVAKTKAGLAVIREGKLDPVGAGAASLTGSMLCVAKGGAIALVSTLSGVTTGSFRIDGAWAARTVSTSGSLVALTAP